MSLHLWSWIAIGLQFVLAIVFAIITQTRLGHPLRKVLFGLAIVLLIHTVWRYFAAHAARPILLNREPDESYASWMGFNTGIWMLYTALFCFLAWIAFWGSILLSNCQLTDKGLCLPINSWPIRYIATLSTNDLVVPSYLRKNTICGLTWKMGSLGAFLFIIGSIVFAVFTSLGLILFVVTGIKPLYLAHWMLHDAGFYSIPQKAWPAIRLRGIRLIPILLPFYPIWGLARGIAWLLNRIPKRLPPVKLEHRMPSVPTPAKPRLEPVCPRQPRWLTLHLVRPASQSLHWLWQLLVAVKRGVCPRIELEDS